jgi:hypothetical protein
MTKKRKNGNCEKLSTRPVLNLALRKANAQKEGTIALSRLGLPVEQIAMALQVDVELAKQWIGDK